MKARSLFAVVPLLLAAGPDFRWSQKSFLVIERQNDPLLRGTQTRDTGLAEYSWRMMVLQPGPAESQLEFAYALGPQVRSQGSFTGWEEPRYRLWDLDEHLALVEKTDGFLLRQNLDRMLLTVPVAGADVHFGRQAMTFGEARILDVMDVVSPFPFGTLDKEYKMGVDAVRVRVPTGDLAELDFAVAGRRHSDREDFGLAFGRAQGVFGGWTGTVLAMRFVDHGLIGTSLAGSAKGAGLWLDAAFTAAGLFGTRVRAQDYARVTVGAEYTLSDGTMLLAEYGWNGAGTERNFSSRLSHVAYRDGRVSLLGRHHLAAQASTNLTPRVVGSLQGILSATDGSASVAPALQFDAAAGCLVNAGAYFQLGKRARGTPEPVSEFGTRPQVYFVETRLDLQ